MAQRFQLELSPAEIDSLNEMLENGTNAEARRARIILLTAEGLAQVAIAADVGLTERQVRRWQRAFQADRMGIFRTTDQPIPPQKTDLPPDPSLTENAHAKEATLTEHPLSEEPVDDPVGSEPESSTEPPPGVTAPRRTLLLRENAGIQPDEPMSEAGRKILFYHFERMLFHEPGSRLGEDTEAVHDMRVATRRMRSAFSLFAPFFRPKVIAPLIRNLRLTARALGAVRDLDVFLEKLNLYQQDLTPDAVTSLTPLIETIHEDRDAARKRLITHLDGQAFAGFVDDIELFLTTPGLGARKSEVSRPAAYQVRHIVPRLIYTRYEAVRAYETILDSASLEMLHTLRIECKRLRYTLEFFGEVMGKSVNSVIEELKLLQDHLGDLNDAQVAGTFLHKFVNQFDKSQADLPLNERTSIEQVVQYMAFQFAERHRLTTTFGEAWARFNRESVRRDLGLAVAAL